jgi:hypothetical protein
VHRQHRKSYCVFLFHLFIFPFLRVGSPHLGIVPVMAPLTQGCQI